MATTLDRIRIAVTTFDDAEQLWSMIGGLVDRGIDPTQLCIVATAPAMALLRRLRPTHDDRTMSAGPHIGSQLADLCEDVEPVCKLRDAKAVLATSGPVLKLLLGGLARGDTARKLIIDENSLDPESSLRQGAPALVVLSNESAQQRTATQMLLRRSQHRVKTFDLALPRELESQRA